MPKPSRIAKDIAERCKDAYSAKAYGSWSAVAGVLLKRGLTPLEAEAVMRSKWTRWARDAAEKDYRYGKYPASIVVDFMNRNPESVQQLTFDTFGRYE